jgi:hypothetical protein
MGFSIKNKQIAFHKLGNIHCTYKIMFLPLQLDHPLWRRGCIAYPWSIVAFSWPTFFYFIFATLDLSIGNSTFVFFVL